MKTYVQKCEHKQTLQCTNQSTFSHQFSVKAHLNLKSLYSCLCIYCHRGRPCKRRANRSLLSSVFVLLHSCFRFECACALKMLVERTRALLVFQKTNEIHFKHIHFAMYIICNGNSIHIISSHLITSFNFFQRLSNDTLSH